MVVARAAEYGEHWEHRSQEISAKNDPARKFECKNRSVRKFEKESRKLKNIFSEQEY